MMLTEFLLARIAEDEAAARRNLDGGLGDGSGYPDYQSYADNDTRPDYREEWRP